jgi:hypothetical protein
MPLAGAFVNGSFVCSPVSLLECHRMNTAVSLGNFLMPWSYIIYISSLAYRSFASGAEAEAQKQGGDPSRHPGGMKVAGGRSAARRPPDTKPFKTLRILKGCQQHTAGQPAECPHQPGWHALRGAVPLFDEPGVSAALRPPATCCHPSGMVTFALLPEVSDTPATICNPFGIDNRDCLTQNRGFFSRIKDIDL